MIGDPAYFHWRSSGGARQYDDVDATILAAAVGGRVAGDGMKFGVAGGRESMRCEAVVDHEDACHPRGARGGQLPIGLKLIGVDGDIVGVALDSNVIGSICDGGRNRVEGGN